jgi:hypothetical protein
LSPAILSGITNALREVIDYEAPTAPNMES